MYFVGTPTAEGLGHRSCPAGLPRGIDRVPAAARRGTWTVPAAQGRIRGEYATGRAEPAGPAAARGAAPDSFPQAAPVRRAKALGEDALPPRLDVRRRLHGRLAAIPADGMRAHRAGGMGTDVAAPLTDTARRAVAGSLDAARALRPTAD